MSKIVISFWFLVLGKKTHYSKQITLNSKGFIPIPFLIIAIIISTLVVVKNTPFNNPQPTVDKQFHGSSSAILKLSSKPSAKTTQSSTSPKPSSSPSPSSSATSINNSNNSTNSTNSNTQNSNSSQTATPTPSPTPSPTVDSSSFSNQKINVVATCSEGNLSLYISGDIPSPADRDQGIWTELVDEQTGLNMLYSYIGNQDNYPIHIAAIIPPTQAIRGSSVIVPKNDGRNYTVNVFAFPYTTGYPSLINKVASVTFSKKCN